MIILTAPQARRVRGRSPANAACALEPILLAAGTFMLGEEVLTDPAHADALSVLTPLTRRAVAPAEFEIDEAKYAAVEQWRAVGTRNISR